ncbi:MAG: MFS transporter, partial [Rubrivivax sp.]
AYTVIVALYLASAWMTLWVAASEGPPSKPAVAPGIAPAPDADAGLAPRPSPWRDVGEGLVHVWRTPRLRAAMSLAALVNLTAFPLTMGLMPYTAREVFHLDQRGLGWLVASFACGALIGSLALSTWGRRLPAARMMLAASMAWYACLGGFVLSTDLWVAMATLVLAGISQSLSMVTLSIILLRTTEERFRGRIMGVRMLAIYTLPLGLMGAGALIPLIGYRPTGGLFVLAGLALTLAIAALWRTELVARSALANAH